MKLTLAEAIACKLTFSSLGYPSKAKQRVLFEADKLIQEEAHKAASRVEAGLCTTCWGDGFHRTGAALLGGPCHACGGTGYTSKVEEAQAQAGRALLALQENSNG